MSMQLVARHAFGVGSACCDVEVVSVNDENGHAKEHVLHACGQHVALTCVEGQSHGEMKFLTTRAKGVREVIALALAPNKKFVAVSECWGAASGSSAAALIDDKPSPGATAKRNPSAEVASAEQQSAANAAAPSDAPAASAQAGWSAASMAHVSIYHMFSGTRVQTFAHAGPQFVATAFSPDSKRVAAVTAGLRPNLANGGAGERPTVVMWLLEKDSVEATATVPAGKVSRLSISTAANGKLCLATTGRQHFKAWLLAESGLKMQTILPSSRERSEHFVDHKWAQHAANKGHTGSAVESIGRGSSGARAGHLEGASPGRSSGGSMSKSGAQQRLLVVSCKLPAANSTRGASTPQSSEQASFASVDAQAAEASIMVFEKIEPLPYLQLHSTLVVPAGTGAPETLAVHAHGFCVGGTFGLFLAYECQEDARTPYVLVRSFCVPAPSPSAAAPRWASLAVSASAELLVAVALVDRSLHTFPLGNMDVLTADHHGGLGEHFCALSAAGAPHDGAILSMDLAAHRPLAATVGADSTVRVWNYRRRQCEISHAAAGVWAGDKPSCVALHPSGFQLIVGFPEKVRTYAVLFKNLKLLHELPLLKCREVRYANGGHQFACCAGVALVVCCAVTMSVLHTFTGHVLAARCVRWALDDLSLFSAGDDGAIYGWDLVDKSRVEEVSLLNRSSPAVALAVCLPPRASVDAILGALTAEFAPVAMSVCLDGSVRDVVWTQGVAESGITRDFRAPVADAAASASSSEQLTVTSDTATVAVTSLALTACGKFVFAGTASGAVRSHAWPAACGADSKLSDFQEFAAHAGAVVEVLVAQEDSLLFSAGADGTLFVFSIHRLQPEFVKDASVANNAASSSSSSSEQMLSRLAHLACSSAAGPSNWNMTATHCADIVQISLEELEECALAVAEMSKRLETQQAENEFALHRKNVEWEAEVRRVSDERCSQLKAETAKLELLQSAHDRAMREHRSELGRKGSHHVQVTHILENQYEHKLALEMERFDRLSEEIEAIQQRCEGLLEAQREEHELAARSAEGRAKRVEKELRQQLDRLAEDAKHNEQTFREVLDQQEHEYETELQHLMAAARSELLAEREHTAEARGLVQARNTKISRLEKRMDELKTSSHARNVLLTAEQVRNAKLEATLRHFKRHMEERESTLEDKELAILGLRRKNVTLDNFRFVLDHRVTQLVEERGPITKHVGGLEAHIGAMYDELEEEYYEKKKSDQQLDSKELKIHTLSQELNALRGLLRERESYVASFKRELSTLVGFTTPKDLEDAIKDAYHKFVKDEQPRHKSSKQRAAQTNAHLDGARAAQHRAEFANDQPNVDTDDPNECAGNAQQASSQLQQQQQQQQQEPHRSGKPSHVELELRDALVEAHSQRACMQRAAGNLKHRLTIAKTDAERLQRVKLGENSQLIKECNQLRGEHLALSREVGHLRQLVKDHTHAASKRKNKHHHSTDTLNSTRVSDQGRDLGLPSSNASSLVLMQPPHSSSAMSLASSRDQHATTTTGASQLLHQLQHAPNSHSVTSLPFARLDGTGTGGGSERAATGAVRAASASAANFRRGGTHHLGAWSKQDATIAHMARQLDENVRVIETQKMQIQKLRTAARGLDSAAQRYVDAHHDADPRDGSTRGLGIDVGATLRTSASLASGLLADRDHNQASKPQLHLGIFPRALGDH